MRGFAHRCPLCGEADALRLHLDDTGVMTCSACDTEVTADDIRGVIAQWEKLLGWIATAPPRKE